MQDAPASQRQAGHGRPASLQTGDNHAIPKASSCMHGAALAVPAVGGSLASAGANRCRAKLRGGGSQRRAHPRLRLLQQAAGAGDGASSNNDAAAFLRAAHPPAAFCARAGQSRSNAAAHGQRLRCLHPTAAPATGSSAAPSRQLIQCCRLSDGTAHPLPVAAISPGSRADACRRAARTATARCSKARADRHPPQRRPAIQSGCR